MMELEGREVVVAAQVECELPPDTRCHVTCQQHQVQVWGAWVGSGALATGWLPTLLAAPRSPLPEL